MGNSFTIKNEDKKGNAVRFESKKFLSFIRRSGKKIYIDPNALNYLESLNGYDQHQVVAGVNELSSITLPVDGM